MQKSVVFGGYLLFSLTWKMFLFKKMQFYMEMLIDTYKD